MNIIKRDGSVVEFDRNKITLAIKKALEACDMASDTIAISVTEDVVTAIGDVPEINQESVLDLVEDTLMKRGLLKVAKAFIKYRYRHAMVRDHHMELINGVLDKLAAKHVVNQNANIDEASFAGRIGEASTFVLKSLAMDFKMSDKTKNNYVQNIVYQHDAEHWATGEGNCETLPLDRLLENGFKLRQGDIRPPQSIGTALQQLVVIMQLQSTQMFGGVAAMADFALVPYVRKSFKKHYLKRALEDYMMDRDMMDAEESEEIKTILWKHPVKAAWYSLDDETLNGIEKAFNKWYMETKGLTDEDFRFSATNLNPTRKEFALQDTRKETHQAVEGLYHNLVSIQARSGNMLPFSSLNYGCCTEPEGRLITEELILGCINGIGKHHSTAVFPCGIFISKNGANRHPGEPNYDLFLLSLASTAKRLYPNYANANWSNQQSWVRADREKKAQIIEALSETEYAQLKDRVAANPAVGDKLMLRIEDDKLVVDDTERPFELMSSMGCLAGDTMIDYKIKDTNYVESFEAAWRRLSDLYPVMVQPNGIDLYIDTPDVTIYECNHDAYVKQYRIIRNHSDQWVKLTFWNGEIIHATPDHPFTDICKLPMHDGTVQAKDLTTDVRLFWDIRPYREACISTCCEKVEPYEESKYSYDVTTETEHFMAGGIESHNCRTVNGYDINSDISYKQAIQEVIETGDTTVDLLSGAQKTGRGNIAPVTIILPELAMMANRDVETFMQLLEITIQEAAESLIERYEIIKSQPPSAAPFQYGNHTMAGYIEGEGIDTALRHGTFAIGQLGVAETLQLLIGTDQTTPEGLELAKRIEQLYKDKINALRAKYKMNFGVYASPSESLCYTALKKFQAKYGKIPNVSDKEFFTNSMHCPVWRKMTPFEKIDIESQLTGYFTAGIITYVELDVSVRHNLEALEKLVLYAMEKDIPYFAINTPNDQCQDCGYEGEIPGPCIKCGSTNIKRLRRVTGYLSSDYHHFNAGKISEVEYRTKHIG